MDESFDFMSLCPRCGHTKLQQAYTYAELRTLLGTGEPIEAYCITCDEVWPIASRERTGIARQLAAEEYRSPLRPRAVRPEPVAAAPKPGPGMRGS